MGKFIVFGLALALAACTRSSPPAPAANDARPAPPATSDARRSSEPADQRARFVDTTWRVESSTAVAPGTRYRFQSDGVLRIDAPGSTPSVGRWTYEHGALVMIEEGIAYPTDILALDEHTFRIRSHNPGTPVDITLVKVAHAPQQ